MQEPCGAARFCARPAQCALQDFVLGRTGPFGPVDRPYFRRQRYRRASALAPMPSAERRLRDGSGTPPGWSAGGARSPAGGAPKSSCASGGSAALPSPGGTTTSAVMTGGATRSCPGGGAPVPGNPPARPPRSVTMISNAGAGLPAEDPGGGEIEDPTGDEYGSGIDAASPAGVP